MSGINLTQSVAATAITGCAAIFCFWCHDLPGEESIIPPSAAVVFYSDKNPVAEQEVFLSRYLGYAPRPIGKTNVKGEINVDLNDALTPFSKRLDKDLFLWIKLGRCSYFGVAISYLTDVQIREIVIPARTSRNCKVVLPDSTYEKVAFVFWQDIGANRLITCCESEKGGDVSFEAIEGVLCNYMSYTLHPDGRLSFFTPEFLPDTQDTLRMENEIVSDMRDIRTIYWILPTRFEADGSLLLPEEEFFDLDGRIIKKTKMHLAPRTPGRSFLLQASTDTKERKRIWLSVGPGRRLHTFETPVKDDLIVPPSPIRRMTEKLEEKDKMSAPKKKWYQTFIKR